MAGRSTSGFTLVEMSVVIVIMGLVMMTVLPAMNTMRSANQATLTQSNLRSLMLATAAYVQANGCLPCPAVPGGPAGNFGKTGSGLACGACSAPQGIPPFASLGVPISTAHDGWGHWITMRIDPLLANPSPVVVPPTAPCTTDDITNGRYGCTTAGSGSYKGLCKEGASPSIINVTTFTPTGKGAPQNAAVIFVSHGQAGYGSYVATPNKDSKFLEFPTNFVPCGTYAGFAQCNSAKNNSTQFFDAPPVASNNDIYDDALAYADRNTLVSMLGNGACNTNWSAP